MDYLSEMLANWMDDVGHPDSVHLVWDVFRINGGGIDVRSYAWRYGGIFGMAMMICI